MLFKLCTNLKELKNNEQGVTAVEYGLIAVAMAAMLTVAFANTDGSLVYELQAAFEAIGSSLDTFTGNVN
ncbi:Flp family type IVb pilin [Vibrio nomapromontoriensis]|uniref:Flp family type IVb pilin n=1 Tax=Vibrio nomapromontoriensis TaxID=2910246 RepID=UPI003D0FBE29